jgi:hypothetical protein
MCIWESKGNVRVGKYQVFGIRGGEGVGGVSVAP